MSKSIWKKKRYTEADKCHICTALDPAMELIDDIHFNAIEGGDEEDKAAYERLKKSHDAVLYDYKDFGAKLFIIRQAFDYVEYVKDAEPGSYRRQLGLRLAEAMLAIDPEDPRALRWLEMCSEEPDEY
jgi:hypothetical protein